MKKRYFLCVTALIFLGNTLCGAHPVFAQDTSPIGPEAALPGSIVVQTIGAQSGAIEWVILLQILALLVLMSLLLNSSIQDWLRGRGNNSEQRRDKN